MHAVALAVSANHNQRTCPGIALRGDLTYKMQADVEQLIGVGKHRRKSGCQFKPHGNAVPLEL